VIKQTNDRNSCRPLPALTLAQYAKIVEQQQTLREVRGFYKRKEKKQNNTKQNKTKQKKGVRHQHPQCWYICFPGEEAKGGRKNKS
jgi:hypothetical protein